MDSAPVSGSTPRRRMECGSVIPRSVGGCGGNHQPGKRRPCLLAVARRAASRRAARRAVVPPRRRRNSKEAVVVAAAKWRWWWHQPGAGFTPHLRPLHLPTVVQPVSPLKTANASACVCQSTEASVHVYIQEAEYMYDMYVFTTACFPSA